MLIISYWFTEKTCYVANSLAGLVTPWTKQLHDAVYTTDSYLWEIFSFVVSKLVQWKHLILLFIVINSHKKPRSYFFCRTLLKVHRFLLTFEMFSLRLIEQRKKFYKTLIILLKTFANALPESKISLFCSRAFPWVKLASNKVIWKGRCCIFWSEVERLTDEGHELKHVFFWFFPPTIIRLLLLSERGGVLLRKFQISRLYLCDLLFFNFRARSYMNWT